MHTCVFHCFRYFPTYLCTDPDTERLNIEPPSPPDTCRSSGICPVVLASAPLPPFGCGREPTACCALLCVASVIVAVQQGQPSRLRRALGYKHVCLTMGTEAHQAPCPLAVKSCAEQAGVRSEDSHYLSLLVSAATAPVSTRYCAPAGQQGQILAVIPFVPCMSTWRRQRRDK